MADYDELAAELFPDTSGSNPQTASQPSAAPANEYDAIADQLFGDQRSAVHASMANAQQIDPDQQAEALRLAQKRNLPTATVRENLDEVRRQEELEALDMDALVQQNPALATWLAKPDNAAVARDDVMGLAEFGKIAEANRAYYEQNDVWSRFSNRVREGFLNLKSAAFALPYTRAIEAGAEAGMTGDVALLNDPITGMPIYASELYGERAAEVVENTRQTGDAAAGDLAAAITPINAELQSIPRRPVTQAMMQAPGFGDALSIFSMDPLGALMDIGVASGVQMMPALALTVATRSPAVAALASGTNSSALEMGGGILQYLGEQGVDTANEALVRRALMDEAVASEAVRYAKTRATIVGTIDALSAGIAGKALLGTGSFAKDTANALVAMPIVQAGLGATGEAAAQVATTGEIGAPGEVLAEALGETVTAPVEALALRGRYAAYQAAADYVRSERATSGAQAFQANDAAADASKLRERSPEKFEEALQEQFAQSGRDSVFIPMDQWETLHQSVGIDPVSAYEQMAGDLGPYREAAATRSDLRVPYAKYLAKMDPALRKKLTPHLRLSPEDMTAFEAEEFRKNQPDIIGIATTAAQTASDALEGDEAYGQIYNDLLGQLLGRFPRDVAEKYAMAEATRFVVFNRMNGTDPLEDYKANGPTITSEVPAALRPRRFETEIDPLIDRLRSGEVPTDAEIYGESLSEFLSRLGGINMTDSTMPGELRRLAESDRATRKGAARLVREGEGMTLDDALVAATEAGYFVDPDPTQPTQYAVNDLLDALDDDTMGRARYSMRNQNDALANLRQYIDDIGEYLMRSGVDLNTTSNEDIKRILRGEMDPAQMGEQPTDAIMDQGPGTAAFDAWFGESVVTETGAAGDAPLIVWHQTSKEGERGVLASGFSTAADIARARLSDEQVPNGIFFKPHDRDIGVGAADRDQIAQIPVYLSIQNPLVVKDRDDLSWHMRSLSPEYAEAEKAHEKIDKEFSPKFENLFGKDSSDETMEATDALLKEWDEAGKSSASKMREMIDRVLAEQGHDGVVILEDAGSMGRKTRTFIALRSEQVKHAISNRGTFDPKDPNILNQAAYHGTPYNFDRFSLDKIGTGEGAQAYGWGLYFAESEGVAKQYRRQLSDTVETPDGTPPLEKRVAQMAVNFGGDDPISWLAKYKNGAQHVTPALTPELVASVTEKFRNGTFKPGGNLYTVDIPDNAVAKMLDWDKPLSEQPEAIRSAFASKLQSEVARRNQQREKLNASSPGRLTHPVIGKLANKVTTVDSLRGEDAYTELVRQLGSQKAASEYLAAAGIPGIRYLDAGSRGAGDGSRNLVVFDDNLVTITHKDGSPVTAAERAEVLNQTAPQTLDGIAEQARADGLKLDVSERGGVITLARIVVPDGQRGAGAGTRVMEQLTRYADATGQRIALSPSKDFGGNVKRLREFYGRFGFKDNKGRSKDFAISETMIREPVAQSPRPVLSDQRSDLLAALAADLRRSDANERAGLPSVIADSLVDGGRLDAKRLAYLLVSHPAFKQEGGKVDVPTFLRVLVKMLSAGRVDPQIFDAIVESVPVDVVNRLAGSKASAKVALDNYAVLQDSSAVNAELPVSSAGDASDPAGLLLREVARMAAEAAGRALRSGLKPAVDGSAGRAGSFDSLGQNQSPVKGKARAKIAFNRNEAGDAYNFNISLLEGADLSSILHEMGHYWLERYGAAAAREGAPEEITRDWQAILDFLGVKDRSEITREHHEKFARAGEAYLMEGKAPSPRLRAVFAKFRAWLLGVYKRLAALNVDLTPEVRAVFDRMYATTEEIAQARETQGMRPVFQNQQQAGMTDEEWAAYTGQAEAASRAAEEDLAAETMEPIRREERAWWRNEKRKVREQVTATINARKDFIALSVLRTGKMPDGREVPDAPKLSKRALQNQFDMGAETLKKLPRGIYSANGGVSPDEIAGMFGYASGKELVEALAVLPNKADLIAQATDAEMKARYPDILENGEVGERAIRAVHNDRAGELLVREAQILAKQVGEAAQGKNAGLRRYQLSMQMAKAAADRVVEATPIRQLSPNKWKVAAAKAGTEAFRLAMEGDKAGALAAKERQILNHALYRAATRAVEQSEKAQEYLGKLAGNKDHRQRIGLAGGWEYVVQYPDGRQEVFDSARAAGAATEAAGGFYWATNTYLDQIDRLLEQYEIRPISNRKLERRESLREFVNGLDAAGIPHAIPAEVVAAARAVSYREIPYGLFMGLRDAVKSIETVAKKKSELIIAKQKRDLQEAAEEIRDGIRENVSGRPPSIAEQTVLRTIRDHGNQALSLYLNANTMTREMDGGETGVVNRLIYQPIAEGFARAEIRKGVVAEQLANLYAKHYSTDELRAMASSGGANAVPVREIGETWKKWDVISLALNWGNEGNRAAIINGKYGNGMSLSQPVVERLLGTLTAKDWAFVQDTWDLVDSFWPEIRAAQQRRTGVAPEKVEATPFTVRAGGQEIELRGGYYPLKFDPRQGDKPAVDEADDLFKQLAAGRAGAAQTKRGHTIERVGSGGRPVRIGMEVLSNHLNQVVYDLEMGDDVAAVYKLLSSRTVQAAFTEVGKGEYWRQLNLWLRDAATSEMRAADIFSRVFRATRTNFTKAVLTFKVTSAALQVTGLVQSATVIGPKAVAKGLLQLTSRKWRGADSAFEQIKEVSPYMKTRWEGGQYNAAVADVLNSARGGVIPAWVYAMGYWMMSRVQMLVDGSTWLGAYDQAIQSNGGDVADARARADDAVKRAQGSGLFVDRAAVERGTVSESSRQGEFLRLWTTLMSYMITKGNLAYEKTKRTSFRDPIAVAKWTVDMAMIFTVEAMLVALIRGEFGDDEDEDGTILDDVAKQAAKETVLSMLGTIPVLNTLGSELQGFRGGTPVNEAFKRVADVMKQVEQGEADKALVKSAVGLTGILIGFPSSQANIAVDALWRDVEGEDVSPLDYILRPAD